MMEFSYLEKGNPEVCEVILRSLPDWFGIEDSTQAYIEKSKTLPMIIAKSEGKEIGFLSLLKHSEYSSEIYVMGVLPDFHRGGIGKKLIEESERILKERGFEFLQVKTLDASRESDAYRKTRLFYKSMGFRELEVFPTLWDEFNPCLLMVKSL